MNFINNILNNTDLVKYFSKVILPAVASTFIMVIISSIVSIIFGLIFGVILFITGKDGIRPSKFIHTILSRITDIVRSFPTMILIVALTPLTRIVVGTKIGITPAIFTISIGCIPFATKMAENAFSQVDNHLIRSAKIFGATNSQIIFKVLFSEALPSLVQNYTIMIINLLNMTAVAGAVGAGGLGAVALTYGYQRFDYAIMYFVVFLLILIVLGIQTIGNKIYKKIK